MEMPKIYVNPRRSEWPALTARCTRQEEEIGERVGEWRIVWGVQRQYRYNGKLYPRVEFQ